MKNHLLNVGKNSTFFSQRIRRFIAPMKIHSKYFYPHPMGPTHYSDTILIIRTQYFIGFGTLIAFLKQKYPQHSPKLFYNKIQHESSDNRAPGDWPDRNIGNQRGRIFALPGVKKHRLCLRTNLPAVSVV